MMISREGPEQPGTPIRQSGTCVSWTPAGGTRADGTWSCEIAISRASTPGSWAVTLLAWDGANNRLRLDRAALLAAGFPGEINVANLAPDVTAPAVTAFAVSPAVVDLSGGDQWIEFAITAADDNSGIRMLGASIVPPGSVDSNGCLLVAPAPDSGAAANGTYRCRYLVLQSSVDGEWAIRVHTEDVLRNRRTYQRAELEAMGLPGSITVTHSP